MLILACRVSREIYLGREQWDVDVVEGGEAGCAKTKTR